MAEHQPPKRSEKEQPSIQEILAAEKDSHSYLSYLEANNLKGLDPLSPQGLKIQAKYVEVLGEHAHPFDVLNRIMKNPFADPKDRIASAKTLLEYSHRKVPANLEVTGVDQGPIKVDATALKALSTPELATLMALLEKAKPTKHTQD